MDVVFSRLDERNPMDHPPPLNVIKLGNEWIVTNGVVAADGSIYFPKEDPGEDRSESGGPPTMICQKQSLPPR
jgi:hypothetical protein